MIVDDGLFNVTQAAAYLSVHRNTMIRIIRRGELPVFQVSTRGDYRIRRKDLDAWLEARRAPAGFYDDPNAEGNDR